MNETEQKALPIFMAALGMNSLEEREQYVDDKCGDDSELRTRVEELLAAQEQSDDFLIPEWMEDDDILEGPGTIIGHYKLLEEIGEGGFGVVFMADQIEPIRRRVALKVVKPGMDSRQVVARFEAERQAVAMMDHPNIAHVYDAGTTDSGRPYFVMELVPGMPITEYCDNAKLTREERIELFIPVCEAIQHAHQKGVIHRDIKPSNILITLHDGKPVPKVIDFGTAKALHQPLTNRTMFTSYGSFVGTPQYMSPEQAEMSGLDIDTRADIYSLGVLLYELLTGTTPFEAEQLRTMAFDKMMHMIREEDPPKPSTRVSCLGERVMDVALRRKLDPKALRRSLQGDLDWIVMKALEKDRKRRYETASALAMDLRRHLSTEPIVARPPSKFYEFQKTVRRHKVGFAATALIIIVLFAGVVVSTWQAHLAQVAQQQAEANEQLAITAQENEAKQREQAQKDELAARRRAYASDMNVAKLALDGDNLGRARDLLESQRPQDGQIDLRGWEWRYLWQQVRSDALFPLCTHPDQISGLSVSADGKLVAIGSSHGGGVSVWDINKRHVVDVLAEDEGSVRTAFSPTEPLLAFAGATSTNCMLHFWNAETGQMIGEFPLSGVGCSGLFFSPDGKTLVTGTALTGTGDITLWSVPDGEKLAIIPDKPEHFATATTPFAVTEDLSLAAVSYSQGSRIKVIDLNDNGSIYWTAPASKEEVTALAFSPDGKMLASAAGWDEKDIRLWDVDSGEEIRRLEGHKKYVSSMVFWPDGRRLASSSGDQTIRIWDVKSGVCEGTLVGHQLEVFRVALFPDGKTLVSASKDGEVCVWDASEIHQRKSHTTIPGHVDAWCFDSNQSVLTFQDGCVMRWSGKDFGDRKLVLEIDTAGYQYQQHNTPIFSRDGRYLAFPCNNGTIIKVWDLRRRTLQTEIPATFSLGFFEDAATLVVGNYINDTYVLTAWDLSNNRALYSWDMMTEGFIGHHPIEVNRDRRELVVIDWLGNTFRANLDDGSATNQNAQAYEIGNLACSPDGNLMAGSSHMGFVKIWDTSTWTELKTLGGFSVGVSSVAFSPDGRRLVTGSDNPETLRIWDTASWRDTLTLEGEGSSFIHTSFSPDGNTIGVWNRTRTLHLWHAPSLEYIEAEEQ